MKFQFKFLIVVAAFLSLIAAWVSFGIGDEELPYISVEDLVKNNYKAHAERFRLGGTVEEGSIERSEDNLTVAFNLVQEDYAIPVSYRSASIPDLFGDGAEVIVEGAWDKKLLTADNLMTKCASRYELEDNYANKKVADAN